MTVKSLAKGSGHHHKKIKSVELLGYGKVKFIQTPEGLIVDLPETPTNTIAPVLKIKK